MKKENKYYTPNIGDFHEGFEFEEQFTKEEKKLLGLKTSTKEEWQSSEYNSEDRERVEAKIEEEKIRCSVLNSKDIEELGFTAGMTMKDDKDEKEVDCFENENCTIILEGQESAFPKITIIKTGETETYTATARNKADLKIMLAHVGVK